MIPSGTKRGPALPPCLDSPLARGVSPPSPEPQFRALVLCGHSPRSSHVLPASSLLSVCAARVPTPWAAGPEPAEAPSRSVQEDLPVFATVSTAHFNVGFLLGPEAGQGVAERGGKATFTRFPQASVPACGTKYSGSLSKSLKTSPNQGLWHSTHPGQLTSAPSQPCSPLEPGLGAPHIPHVCPPWLLLDF